MTRLCRLLAIRRSAHYRWLTNKPGTWVAENAVLLMEIKAIHQQSRQTYGSPRVTQQLQRRGYCCSRARVARLMAKNHIAAKTKRKFKVITDSHHHHLVSPDLLNQDFNSNGPNHIWVSDITYIRTKAGWLYLTVILDLFNRQVVGWSLSHRLTTITTTLPALTDAFQRQRSDAVLIFHSDRGVQYACQEFRHQLAGYQMVQSMSGKGNCYANAVAESFFHTLKSELVYFEQYETNE